MKHRLRPLASAALAAAFAAMILLPGAAQACDLKNCPHTHHAHASKSKKAKDCDCACGHSKGGKKEHVCSKEKCKDAHCTDQSCGHCQAEHQPDAPAAADEHKGT